jgi:ribosomal-protein-alanine N-acetyltransferase
MSGNVEPVRIRRMEQGDIDSVIAIAESLPHAPRWPREAYLRAVDTEATPARLALVVESVEKQVIGFAVSSLIPPQAELETIAIARPAQRRGFGLQLLSQLAEESRKTEITEVTLEVRASNEPGLRLYRAVGFVSIGVRHRYYIDPEEDAVVMSLAIDGERK